MLHSTGAQGLFDRCQALQVLAISTVKVDQDHVTTAALIWVFVRDLKKNYIFSNDMYCCTASYSYTLTINPNH